MATTFVTTIWRSARITRRAVILRKEESGLTYSSGQSSRSRICRSPRGPTNVFVGSWIYFYRYIRSLRDWANPAVGSRVLHCEQTIVAGVRDPGIRWECLGCRRSASRGRKRASVEAAGWRWVGLCVQSERSDVARNDCPSLLT